jgi:hypothetical protein
VTQTLRLVLPGHSAPPKHLHLSQFSQQKMARLSITLVGLAALCAVLALAPLAALGAKHTPIPAAEKCTLCEAITGFVSASASASASASEAKPSSLAASSSSDWCFSHTSRAHHLSLPPRSADCFSTKNSTEEEWVLLRCHAPRLASLPLHTDCRFALAQLSHRWRLSLSPQRWSWRVSQAPHIIAFITHSFPPQSLSSLACDKMMSQMIKDIVGNLTADWTPTMSCVDRVRAHAARVSAARCAHRASSITFVRRRAP